MPSCNKAYGNLVKQSTFQVVIVDHYSFDKQDCLSYILQTAKSNVLSIGLEGTL
jgi:hypothetical protein